MIMSLIKTNVYFDNWRNQPKFPIVKMNVQNDLSKRTFIMIMLIKMDIQNDNQNGHTI